MKAYELLNKLYETGELKELYKAGIVSPVCFNVMDACNMFLTLRKIHTYVDARFIICQRLQKSETTIDNYLKKGGVK